MEHMKRMLVMVVAVVLAGAGLMYVHKNMYKNCADNVQVQSMAGNEGYQQGSSGYNYEHRQYEENLHRSPAPAPMPG